MVFRIEVNLGNRFLLLKTMKRRFGNIQTSNLFSMNSTTPKHIRHCQKFCTFCSPERYTIMIHNENVNQIHYTMCPYDELLIMAKSIHTSLVSDTGGNNNCLKILVLSITCGKLSNFTKCNPVLITPDNNINNNDNNTGQNDSTKQTTSNTPQNTTVSINIQTINKSVKRRRHHKLDSKQSKTKSNWGIINIPPTCENIHSNVLIELNKSFNNVTMEDGKKNISSTDDNNNNHQNHHNYCYYYYYYYCYHYYYSLQKIPYYKSLWHEKILDVKTKDTGVIQSKEKNNCNVVYGHNNTNQYAKEKYADKVVKVTPENDIDNEVMRYMTQSDLIKSCAQIQTRSQRLTKLKSGILPMVNSRPPEPVGCQLLEMTTAPAICRISRNTDISGNIL
uniref:Uncharacterized protein n=1 Tax=Trichobilharzia regenti TaxID=157069 RepID=A0AA85JWJ6_TRIRE|nr:unnamed protein product [Trichobilharzia regenti]